MECDRGRAINVGCTGEGCSWGGSFDCIGKMVSSAVPGVAGRGIEGVDGVCVEDTGGVLDVVKEGLVGRRVPVLLEVAFADVMTQTW